VGCYTFPTTDENRIVGEKGVQLAGDGVLGFGRVLWW
jgi:hypothetical protein